MQKKKKQSSNSYASIQKVHNLAKEGFVNTHLYVML